jgi:two-component system response regulator ResD
MVASKILIVDDEDRMRRLVGDFLKKQGYAVTEAADGREALDLFMAQSDIDLIILDVMMPEYDGWAVCREIRKTSQVPLSC